ncbi:hypothetical protein COBT_001879 [Conglomerata obtusa]
MNNCIFCTLLADKINIIYETKTLFVIPDINPLSRNHLLIIPKAHATFLHKSELDDVSEVFKTVIMLVNALKLTRYNLLQNNGHIQSVPHVHFHLIPCNDNNEALDINWKCLEVEETYAADTLKKTRKMINDYIESIKK